MNKDAESHFLWQNAIHSLGLDLFMGNIKNIWLFNLISNLHIQITTKSALLFIISDIRRDMLTYSPVQINNHLFMKIVHCGNTDV